MGSVGEHSRFWELFSRSFLDRCLPAGRLHGLNNSLSYIHREGQILETEKKKRIGLPGRKESTEGNARNLPIVLRLAEILQYKNKIS